MTNDKSGVWEIGGKPGATAMAGENPVNDYLFGVAPPVTAEFTRIATLLAFVGSGIAVWLAGLFW